MAFSLTPSTHSLIFPVVPPFKLRKTLAPEPASEPAPAPVLQRREVKDGFARNETTPPFPLHRARKRLPGLVRKRQEPQESDGSP